MKLLMLSYMPTIKVSACILVILSIMSVCAVCALLTITFPAIFFQSIFARYVCCICSAIEYLSPAHTHTSFFLSKISLGTPLLFAKRFDSKYIIYEHILSLSANEIYEIFVPSSFHLVQRDCLYHVSGEIRER